MNLIYFIFILLFGCSNEDSNTLSVSSLFSDGLILQRDTTVAIWGSASPNTIINLESSWGPNPKTKTDNNGKWSTLIKTHTSGGPHWLKIKSREENIFIKDILFGEIWLAAGQSNMEMNFDYCCNSTDSSDYEISNADYHMIRMFNVKKHLSYNKTDHLDGSWVPATDSQIVDFSAVGYYFAKNLQKTLNVPIGIIHASWGGSNAESWTSLEALNETNNYNSALSELKMHAAENKTLRNFLEKYKSTPLPSSGWDLFLGEFLKKKDPNNDYLSYFHEDWAFMDFLGAEIINEKKNINNWVTVETKEKILNYINYDDFIGSILFKNVFIIDSENDNVTLEFKPDKDLKFGLWEYDIFINGKNILSTLINNNQDNYEFEKQVKNIQIGKEILQKGKNKLIIRTIGQPLFGEVKLKTTKNTSEIELGTWEMHVLGEEFFQYENYNYPYTSFFEYEDKRRNSLERPKKTYLSHRTLGSIYNGMLNPIVPFTIKGVIWYQGESNIEVGDKKFKKFSELMPLMVEDWRSRWGNDFPFYFAQIAPYFNYQGMLPYFQDVQSKLAKVIPNSKMIVLNDIGENYDIHPSNKHDVGYRFSQVALSKDYGFDLVSSGPIYNFAKIKNNKVEIYFEPADLELKINSETYTSFEIAGIDEKYHNASVRIVDDYIEAFSDSVINPVYFRYAWSDTAFATLFNKSGWPALLFSNKEY